MDHLCWNKTLHLNINNFALPKFVTHVSMRSVFKTVLTIYHGGFFFSKMFLTRYFRSKNVIIYIWFDMVPNTPPPLPRQIALSLMKLRLKQVTTVVDLFVLFFKSHDNNLHGRIVNITWHSVWRHCYYKQK